MNSEEKSTDGLTHLCVCVTDLQDIEDDAH